MTDGGGRPTATAAYLLAAHSNAILCKHTRFSLAAQSRNCDGIGWIYLNFFWIFNSRGFYYKLLQRKLGLRPPVSFTAAKVAVPNYLQGALIVKMQMQFAISMCKRKVVNHVFIHTRYISVRKSISWIKLKAIF